MKFATTIRSRLTRRPRRGNGVLEAALVLPVLLSLSMGMVEFGQFFYAKHTLQAASRDGARNAILSTVTHSQAVAAVNNTMAAGGMSDTSKFTLTFQNASGGATITDVGTVAKGTSIKVTVSSTVGNVSVRPLGVIPAAKPVVGVTTMIKE
jgi:Flp pilus assembly protein TadG